MGPRGRLALLLVAACGPARGPEGPSSPAPTAERVVADFEAAVRDGRDTYLALFDFSAVGSFEKLLHPYDLLGRSPLTPEQRAQYEKEDAVPYPAARERRNLGLFYPPLAKRTVGSGGCRVVSPRSEYARLLGVPFEPLPPDRQAWEPMRQDVNRMIAEGGLVALACSGGEGQLALVWTRAANPRGYVLVTMYDDVIE
jgi:hypothetical protein